jgi:hypothetical protein
MNKMAAMTDRMAVITMAWMRARFAIVFLL